MLETNNNCNDDDHFPDAVVLEGSFIPYSSAPILIPDEELDAKIVLLNEKQRKIF